MEKSNPLIEKSHNEWIEPNRKFSKTKNPDLLELLRI